MTLGQKLIEALEEGRKTYPKESCGIVGYDETTCALGAIAVGLGYAGLSSGSTSLVSEYIRSQKGFHQTPTNQIYAINDSAKENHRDEAVKKFLGGLN